MDVSREKRKIELTESVYHAFVDGTRDVQDQEEWRFLVLSVMQMFMRALESYTRFNLLTEDLMPAKYEVRSHAENGLRRIHLVPKLSRAEPSEAEKG
jgi:hypothetical protein